MFWFVWWMRCSVFLLIWIGCSVCLIISFYMVLWRGGHSNYVKNVDVLSLLWCIHNEALCGWYNSEYMYQCECLQFVNVEYVKNVDVLILNWCLLNETLCVWYYSECMCQCKCWHLVYIMWRFLMFSFYFDVCLMLTSC
mgnify:CR=1 FL=1